MNQRLLSFTLITLLLAAGATALDVRTNHPATLRTGEVGTLELQLRAEKNYSSQRVELTITGAQNALIKGCNQTHQETFSIQSHSWNKIRRTLQFSEPGTYTIDYRLENTRYNQTGQLQVTVTGPTRQIAQSCAKAVGNRREKYGQGQPSPVKDRLKTTPKKYAVW